MASLGDLVVKIGADTRDLNKQLGKVQREFRSMTGNITQLGQNLTRSLTVPLAAMGAAAVKSAADLETLETSFISLTGGAEQAKNMVAQLNKFTAETPFQLEQVGKAARQLIASGTAVDEVSDRLQFLGDIAATSGTSIDEIAAIFAKVQAKGKVELENLNQLAERGIPIFTALSEATGLLPSELGAGAVSVEQFNKTLQSFAEDGGFANGAMERLSKTAAGRFSTALDNAKLALANVGEQALPAVNAALEKFTSLMQGFAKLTPTTLKMTGAIAGIAAAIGPLLTVMPKIVAGINALKASMLLTTPAILGVAAVAGTLIGLFVRIRGEAKQSADQVDEVTKALDELSQAELRRQSGVTKGADEIAINAAIEDSLSKVAEANEELAAVERKIQEGGAGLRAVYANKIKDLKAYRDEYQRSADAGKLLIASLNETGDKLVETGEAKIPAFLEGLSKMEGQTFKTNEKLGYLLNMLSNIDVKTKESTKSMNDLFRMLTNTEVQSVQLTTQVNQMGVAMVNAFTNAASSAQSFAGFAVEAIKGVIIAYLAEAKTRVIANSAEAAAGTGPAYPFVMAGMIGAGMALINKIPIPALAEGGLASGPTMAIVGDNRNAAIDPEVISPLSKLKDMMGGSQVEVFGRISGNDIFLSNTRSGFKRNRYS
jgi:tape measure domain-containing protein